jgi:hypothetical protein
MVMGGEEIERPSHEMHNTQRMGEPAVLGALVGEHRKPELLDAAKPLKLRGVDQLDDQSVFGC